MLGEADRLGMQVDTTLGAGWPLETPNTEAGTGLSLQELQYGRADLDGGDTFDGPVPAPFDDPDNARGARLVAVTAARVVQAGPPVEEVDEPPASSTVLDPDSLVDLTAKASEGELTWTAPEGEWIVFGFWQRDAREDVHDHFNRAAIEAAVEFVREEQFTAKALEDFSKTGYSIFEDSIEINAEGIFWTDAMAEHFADRHAYDATKYLPLFFQQGMNAYWVPEERPPGDFDLPDGGGERIRNDYYQLLTDLYVDEHLLPLVDLAREMGVQFRTQAAYGMNLDAIRSAREIAKAGGLPDEESFNAGDVVPYDLEGAGGAWRFAFDHHRLVSSGAHQGGVTEISSELGAQPGTYVRTLGDYKGIMDKEWAAGTTRPLLLGVSYQTSTAQWPGDAAFGSLVSESWNAEHFPQWEEFTSLNDYWARGALILQTGTPRTDVAVYSDDFVTTAARPGRPDELKPFSDLLSTELQGYSVGYVDPQGLLEPSADGDGTLFPDGPDYNALVIDERALPVDVAERLAEEAEQGLPVVFVGELPDAGTGYANPEAADQRVRAAVQRMLAQSSVARVAAQADVAEVLPQRRVSPAAAWSEPAQVYAQRRQTEHADYYYLYNATSEPVSFEGSFTGEGRPYSYDLWTGEVSPMAHYDHEAGRTTLPIELDALGTAVVAVARHAVGTPHVVDTDADETVALGRNRVELRSTTAGPVHFETSTGRSGRVEIDALPESRSTDGT